MQDTITIVLDPETARALDKLSPERKRKLELFLRISAKNAILGDRGLLQAMDEMSLEAEANGLTPEILESLLNNG